MQTLPSVLANVTDRPISMNILPWWGLNCHSSEGTYIMVWASWKNSSSDMEPSLIILMATSYCPFHLPRWTTPNWPLPSSFNSVISSLFSSQIPNKVRQTLFRMRIESFGTNSFFPSDFVSKGSFTLIIWRRARLFILSWSLKKKKNPWWRGLITY